MKKEVQIDGRVARTAALEPYTTIYLIRHCQPNYALKEKLGDFDMPLSQTGIRQAENLSRFLDRLGLQAIYSSAMKRSLQTAKIFLGRKKLKLNVREELNEFDWTHWYRVKYFNISEEKRGEQIKEKSQLNRRLNQKKEYGKMALAKIIKENRYKNIAIFSHGNFIKSILAGILDSDVFGFLSLEVFQASVSKIIVDSGGNVIISYINDTSYLPKRPVIDRFLSILNR